MQRCVGTISMKLKKRLCFYSPQSVWFWNVCKLKWDLFQMRTELGDITNLGSLCACIDQNGSIWLFFFTCRLQFPDNWQVILTADIPVVDNRGGIIFTSTDAGATFKFIQLPFHLAQPITYHFLNPDYLVALSIDVSRMSGCVSLCSLKCYFCQFWFLNFNVFLVSLAVCSILG